MNVEELEVRIKNLENQNVALQNQVRMLQDTEEIKKLQRAYGYYLEHDMFNEIADLFTDDGKMVWVGIGSFFGKEKIRKQWSLLPGQGTPKVLHHAMQISPIVTVSPDGKTAKGRWYAFGIGVLPLDEKRLWSAVSSGLYENEYEKQNGIWKIKVLEYGGIIGFDVVPHFIDPERCVSITDYISYNTSKNPYPFDVRHDWPKGEYPSGYIRPFHYKHPVTGKETSERARNESLKKTPLPGRSINP
jgi:hypothetical protein